MNAEHWRKFLESLSGDKGLRERVHLWQLSDPLNDVFDDFLSILGSGKSEPVNCYLLFTEYLMERCRRAEIPDLKEKVKAFGRDAMDAQAAYDPDPVYDVKTGKQVVGYSEAEQFRALCEPEKDSKEVQT